MLAAYRPNMPPKPRPPPLSDDSVIYPTNRLPRLDVPIMTFPAPGSENQTPLGIHDDKGTSPPSAVVPEKTLYNIWEQTRTQTEVKWTRPDNAGSFDSMAYEIQINDGDGTWQNLTENRVPVYRVYFAEGKAIFGRTRICQQRATAVVRLRVRPIGIISRHGAEERLLGPWCENILFSIEGTNSKT
ncbi:unnamed protein product [Lymnaea stagnalis]|uniref:Fibronectin type-III domain-containing protein n=1 Tax=Lymnaea stagnalis TaxID=6523 RepID=A0AAV2HEU0_LYMST